jgi:hypothetical protein
MFLADKRAGGEYGSGQLAYAGLIVAIGKRIAEHHRAIAYLVGKYLVVVELRLQLLERALKTRHVSELLLRELLEHLEARAFIALRKDNVKTDDIDAVLVEQFVDKQRESIARPRPAPFTAFFSLGQAFFVDIENDDARIDGTWHGQHQATVIDDRLQALYQRQLDLSCRVEQEKEQQDEPEADAYDVLLQPASLMCGNASSACGLTARSFSARNSRLP